MGGIRTLTAGESHGAMVTGIIEGVPSNLELCADDIDKHLGRRQKGYGRGGRMKIETDKVKIISGLRWGKTLGSPIALAIENKDWVNWHQAMSVDSSGTGSKEPVIRPRPGHADLSGALKYGFNDVRNVLERSSARETSIRVAIGAVCRKFLEQFGIFIGSYVLQIGNVGSVDSLGLNCDDNDLWRRFEQAESSNLRCPYEETDKEMVRLIDSVKEAGDSLGGIFEVFVLGVPVGLGSYVHWDRRLDGKLAQAVMSVQAVKGVEVGAGFEFARRRGSEVMDEIYYEKGKTSSGFYRKTNNAGGIEGGMSNGAPIVVRASMKPIPTQGKPLRSVNIQTKESMEAAYERSDVCAVPACGVVAEAAVALVLADVFLEKFGGDSILETTKNYESFIASLESF